MKFLGRLVGVIGFLVGIGLLAGGIYLAHGTMNFLATAERVPGTVIAIHDVFSSSSHSAGYSSHPVVRYAVAGRKYVFQSSLGSNPPAYVIGERVVVLYPSAHPEQGRIDSFLNLWLAPMVMGGIGAVVVLIALGAALLSRRHRRRRRLLLQTGQRIEARITGVGADTRTSINGINPFRITAQWLDPGTKQLHVFNSDHIWFDPSEFLPEGHRIFVYIDPADPRRYTVDTAFLPKRA